MSVVSKKLIDLEDNKHVYNLYSDWNDLDDVYDGGVEYESRGVSTFIIILIVLCIIVVIGIFIFKFYNQSEYGLFIEEKKKYKKKKKKSENVNNSSCSVQAQNVASLKNANSIEFMSPIDDSIIKELDTFGRPANNQYPNEHIGRLWFGLQHNRIDKLVLNIIKAENLASLFLQNEPSTMVKVSIVVNGYFDKNESYRTQIHFNNRKPVYFDVFQIPLLAAEISLATLLFTIIEVNPNELSIQKPLGYVFYNLQKFSVQSHDYRFLWRDIAINASYSTINEKKTRKIIEFESKGKVANENKTAISKQKTKMGIFCEIDLVYEANMKVLKVLVFSISSITPNKDKLTLCVQGFINESLIFSSKNGTQFELNLNKISYDTVFQIGIEKHELEKLSLGFQLLNPEDMRISQLKSLFSTYSQVFIIFPLLFLFLFASEINIIAQNSLVFRKLCVSLYSNVTICESYIFKNETYQNEVETLSNEWNLWLSIAFFIPAIISALYLASNADRKSSYQTFMLISLAGFIVFSIICAIAATQETYLCLNLMLLAQILNGVLGGGSLAYITACFSFISANEDNNKTYTSFTSNKVENKYSKRSIKYSILESATLFGRFLGSILSGYLLSNKTNFLLYQNTFLISLAIFVFLFFYTILLFQCYFNNKSRQKAINVSIINPNYASNVDLTPPTADNDDANEDDKIGYSKKTCKAKALERLLYITDIYKVFTKKRENNIRFYFLMFLFIYFLTSLISFGVGTIDYLFLTKIPISMKQTEYGVFRALNTFFKGIALLIILPVLKNYFHIADYVLFLIGLVSDIANYTVFSIASSVNNVIWLSPIAYMFANYYVVCLRSFVSKLIEKHDIGKFFGIISIIEFLAILIGSSIFNRIYKETIKSLPSAVYIISALFTLFVCFTMLLYTSIKFNRNEDLISRNRVENIDNNEPDEIDS